MARGRGAENGAASVDEMQEFAGFAKGTQRYIRRSLDVGLGRRDAARRWARDPSETATILAQSKLYERLDAIRAAIPDDPDVALMEPMMAPLIFVTAYDLSQRRLDCFQAYRFLYERLLGAAIRPWLPGAFCAAASLPHLHPETRKGLLATLSQSAATAPGWSSREPVFFPEWVEKIDATIAA
jgi:hypothetical protein